MRLSYRSKLMLKKLFRVLLILLAVALVAAIVVLIYVEPFVIYDRTGAHLEFEPSTESSVELQAPETRPVVENPQIIYSVGETAQYVLSEENVNWYWRVVVNVLGADAPEAQPAA